MIVETIALIITGIAALIVQMIYFLIDDRSENQTARDRRIKKYWHWAGGAIHIWMGYAVARITHDWRWGFLMGILTWYFFDGFINTYVLLREWWYIGDTALLDIAQRKVAYTIHMDPRLFSACLKHAALLFSITQLIPGLL
jgi:hypothetical protein